MAEVGPWTFGWDALVAVGTLSLAAVTGGLFLYPEGLTLEELIREFESFSGASPQRDAIERAVRDLAGVGLLHQVGPLVLPTRSAVVFHRLEER
jgi:hypothetical protein